MEQKVAHMCKATLGPWNCNRSSASGYDIVCSENSPTDVCVISRRDKTTGEIDANARLIAAAPELLEACKRMIEWDDREHDHPQRQAAYRNARDAIAKAEGGAA